jgi:serine/threonine protein kinase
MKSKNPNFSKDDIIFNNKYIIKKFIDSGGTSTVYKCIDNETGLLRAAKFFENIPLNSFEREVNIMKKISEINSPSLMKCYESGIAFLTQNGESVKKMYCILEYGEHGSLFDAVLKTKNGFSEDVTKYIFSQILKGVEDLHKNGICHGDIKLENILLFGDNYEIKLCDFGYSTRFLDDNNQKKKLNGSKGTACYAAPELFEDKEYEGDKIDIFSLGALLFVLMTKKFGFLKATIDNISMDYKKILYKLIKTKQYQKYWKILEKKCQINSLSENFKNLFLKMVAYKPEERPTIDEIKNDEWLKDMINATPEQLNFLRNKMISEIEAANN